MRRRIAALACVLVWTVAPAETLVSFEDGRALRAEGLQYRDGFAGLTLPGGTDIWVPVESIVDIAPIDPLPPDPLSEPLTPLEPEVLQALALQMAGEAWREAAGVYADILAEAADRHGVDRALFAAVAKVESNFDAFAVSPVGACGLLQLMPVTAKRFGVKRLFDPRENADGGARYLRWLLDRFDGRVDLALAGYKAGEGAVDRHRGIPPYRETRAYVNKVLAGAEASSAP